MANVQLKEACDATVREAHLSSAINLATDYMTVGAVVAAEPPTVFVRVSFGIDQPIVDIARYQVDAPTQAQVDQHMEAGTPVTCLATRLYGVHLTLAEFESLASKVTAVRERCNHAFMVEQSKTAEREAKLRFVLGTEAMRQEKFEAERRMSY